ncbi:hypothetical protein E2C01_061100 [Portunus trituberculatus]|uniref:Uncharacterized protein n=1 Tax=Portunus trituberculatus TaxID=210409 RepID=A0A5B7H2Z2_PORTR|nr:hypothetical protein [Portunus trituberculatus]
MLTSTRGRRNTGDRPRNKENVGPKLCRGSGRQNKRADFSLGLAQFFVLDATMPGLHSLPEGGA